MPGLYIHIPFCARKCPYCDFYSVTTGNGMDPAHFLNDLDMELRHAPDDFLPDTIFIGGGTPTELSVRDLEYLMEILRSNVDLSAVGEWTCESNPGTLTPEKASVLRDAGVNRISLGAQSFDENNLNFLGRIHSPGDIETGYRILRNAGFTNINLDLIYGIPGSAPDRTQRDVETALSLGPEHLACYHLTFEPDTPLTRMRDQGLVREVNEEESFRQYHMIRQMAREAGYVHYEISNFALPDRESRHNLLYWGNGEYLGFGPAAHSHWRGARWGHIRNLTQYSRAIRTGGSIRAFTEQLDTEAKARETLVMWLRRIDGVPREEFLRQTGYDYRVLCGSQIDTLTEDGLLSEHNNRLALTGNGLFVSDRIFSELL